MLMSEFYQSPTRQLWTGRIDGPEALRLHEVVELLNLDNAFPVVEGRVFGLIGFACDEGIRRNQGRCGAANGPNAIRTTLSTFPSLRNEAKVFDCGNIICKNGDLETAQEQLANAIELLHRNRIRPIVLGGGHEVAWGHFRGINKALPDTTVHVVNCDAHFDLRPLLDGNAGHSGSSFYQIATSQQKNDKEFRYTCLGIQENGNTDALFKRAESLGVKYISAEKFHFGGYLPAQELVDEILHHSDSIYLSICLDVFASPYAPGVSAPQILGLLPWHLIPLIKTLSSSGKVVGFDIAELSPPYDIDQRTAKLAANLIYCYMA